MTKKITQKQIQDSVRKTWGNTNPCSRVFPDKKAQASKNKCRQNTKDYNDY